MAGNTKKNNCLKKGRFLCNHEWLKAKRTSDGKKIIICKFCDKLKGGVKDGNK